MIENPANPAQPRHAAAGPPLADRVAPTAQPEITGFHTSCFALYFSTRHSTPPKRAVKIPKLFAQPRDLNAMDLNPDRTCSRKGACGTSLPLTIWIGDTSPIAPINKPIATPSTDPINAPVIIFIPHDSFTKVGKIGYSSGAGVNLIGLKNGKYNCLAFSPYTPEVSIPFVGFSFMLESGYRLLWRLLNG